jgi:hypothetical protein
VPLPLFTAPARKAAAKYLRQARKMAFEANEDRCFRSRGIYYRLASDLAINDASGRVDARSAEAWVESTTRVELAHAVCLVLRNGSLFNRKITENEWRAWAEFSTDGRLPRVW